MYIIVVFAAVLAIVQANTNVQRCLNNPGNLPTSTHIEGCTEPPCQLPQLQDAVIHMNFTAPYRLDNMRTLATVYIRLLHVMIPVPYDLGAAANTCNFLTNTRCPVNQGTVVKYTLRMFIETFFPVDTVMSIEFRIVDNGPLFCIRVPIRIVGPGAIGFDDIHAKDTVKVVDNL